LRAGQERDGKQRCGKGHPVHGFRSLHD
jgi:hypothetical protein